MRKDYLICVDSDGCAIDSMDIKHVRCFGPCLIKEWDLEEWTHVKGRGKGRILIEVEPKEKQ